MRRLDYIEHKGTFFEVDGSVSYITVELLTFISSHVEAPKIIEMSGYSILYFMSEHYQMTEIKQANKRIAIKWSFSSTHGKKKNNSYVCQLTGKIARDENVNVRSLRLYSIPLWQS